MKASPYLILSLLLSYLCQAQTSTDQWSVFIKDSIHIQHGAVFIAGNNPTYITHTSKNNLTATPYLNISSFNSCGIPTQSVKLSIGDMPLEKIIDTDVDAQNNLYILALPSANIQAKSFVLIKINPQAQLVWANQYTAPHDCFYYSFGVDGSGNAFLNFNNSIVNNPDNVVMKIAPNGQLLWSNSYGGGYVYGFGAPSGDGGYIWTMGNMVKKIDAAGNMLWKTNMPGQYVTVDPIPYQNGNVLVQTDGISCRLVMLKADGSLAWHTDRIKNFTPQNLQLINGKIKCLGISQGQLALLELPNPNSPQVRILQNSNISTAQRARFLSSNQNMYVAGNISTLSATGLLLAKIPEIIDSSSCFSSTYNTQTEASTLVLTPQSVDAVQSYPFSTQNIKNKISISSTSYNEVSYLCQKLNTNYNLELGNDTTLCPGEFITLSAPTGGNYKWNTGSTSRVITATEAGTYYVDATFGCDTTTYTDTIIIDFHPDHNFELHPEQTTYYEGDTIAVYATGHNMAQFSWYVNGSLVDKNSSTLQYITSIPGEYNITAYLKAEPSHCTYAQTLRLLVFAKAIHFPNVFTPNGDGINDWFKPLNISSEMLNIAIYNRYGTLIAKATQAGWDGKNLQGKDAAEGVYFYIASTNSSTTNKGTITLMR